MSVSILSNRLQVEVFLFTGMAALLFGLAGVQLFAGAFRRGCVLATGQVTILHMCAI